MFTSTASWRTTRTRREVAASVDTVPSRREQTAVPHVVFQNETFLAEMHTPLPRTADASIVGKAQVVRSHVSSLARAYLLLDCKILVWHVDTDGFQDQQEAVCDEILLPRCPAGPYLASTLGSGLLTCSASGTLKHWPSTAVPGSCVSHSMALPADATVVLATSCNDGIWLATSDHQLYYVRLSAHGFWPPRMLQKPSGVLGFLSWSSWKSGTGGSRPLVRLASCQPRSGGAPVLFALTQHSLEVWTSTAEADTLTTEFDVKAKVEQAVREANASAVTATLLDFVVAEPLVYITVHVEAMDGARYFAVAKVELDGTQASLVAVTRLSCTLPTRPDLAAVRMCLTEAAEDEPVIAVVHWRGTVLVANLEDGAEGMVSAQSATFVLEADDEVVGHGAVGGCGSVLLVTRKHGIVSLAANQLNKNPAVYQVTEAFNNYLQDPSSLPQRPLPRMQPATLSKAVVDCSLAMIDRLPLYGPNWADGKGQSADSAFLKGQLQAKDERHSQFLSFLAASGLLSRLSLKARFALLEHKEKIMGAIALWQQSQRSAGSQRFCKEAIERKSHTRDKRDTATTGTGLSEQDVFFSEVSHVAELLLFIPLPSVGGSAASTALALAEANGLFVALFSSPWRQRARSKEQLELEGEAVASGAVEQVTGSVFWCFEQKLRDRLRRQIQATVAVIKELQTSKSQLDLVEECLQQLVALCDALLASFQDECFLLATLINVAQKDDRLHHLASKNRERLDVISGEFDQVKRETLLHGLLACSQYVQAKQLGEKYRDFEALITACEFLGDSYEAAMLDRSFRMTLFRWYLEHKQFAKLLSMPEEYADDVREVTRNNSQVAWMHAVQCRDYQGAASILIKQGSKQSRVAESRTSYSIAKLAHLMGSMDDNLAVSQLQGNAEWRQANAGLDYLKMQEVLFPPTRANQAVKEPASLLSALDPSRNDSDVVVNSFYDKLNVLLVVHLRDGVSIEGALEHVWLEMLCLSPWLKLAEEMAASGAEQVNVRTHILESIVFQVSSRFSVNGQTVVTSGLLSKEILQRVEQKYVEERSQEAGTDMPGPLLQQLMSLFHQLEIILCAL